VVAVEELAFAPLHGRRLLIVGVVHPEEVEDAVDHEEGELILVGAGVVGGVAPGDRGTDHHVAEEGRQVGGL
jgi:hypothetical protein